MKGINGGQWAVSSTLGENRCHEDPQREWHQAMLKFYVRWSRGTNGLQEVGTGLGDLDTGEQA